MFSKSERSRIMASVHSYNTKPELIVRKALKGKGFAYQPKIKGRPDFINRKAKIVIFVNGCFWHKCKIDYRKPNSNVAYWESKIERNVKKDKVNKAFLVKRGYKVLTVWEHQLKRSNKDFKKVSIMLANISG